jgi:hypothetical protein
VDQTRSVDAWVHQELGLGLSSEPGVLGRPHSRRLLPQPPGMEPAARHSSQPAKSGDLSFRELAIRDHAELPEAWGVEQPRQAAHLTSTGFSAATD